MEKIAVIENMDPSAVSAKEWSRNPTLYHLWFADIDTYLVCGVSAYTGEEVIIMGLYAFLI